MRTESSSQTSMLFIYMTYDQAGMVRAVQCARRRISTNERGKYKQNDYPQPKGPS